MRRSPFLWGDFMRFLQIVCLMVAMCMTGCGKSGPIAMPNNTVAFDPEKDKLTTSGGTSGGLGMKKTKPGGSK